MKGMVKIGCFVCGCWGLLLGSTYSERDTATCAQNIQLRLQSVQTKKKEIEKVISSLHALDSQEYLELVAYKSLMITWGNYKQEIQRMRAQLMHLEGQQRVRVLSDEKKV